MQMYQFAETNGTIVSEEYDSSIRPSQEETESLLRTALSVFGRSATVEKQLEETYKISYDGNESVNEIYVSLKPVTPGGRSSAADLNNEHRILQLPEYLSWVNDRKEEGKRTAFLGIYRRNSEILICAWKVVGTNADPKSRVSKQVKVDTLASAMRNGIAQQKRGENDFVCVFRKEFIYFFFENIDQLTGANMASPATSLTTVTIETPNEQLEEIRNTSGRNILLYGVPGSGKSWTIEHELIGKKGIVERLVFHPDYTNADFVGQIMPVVEDKQVTYEFTEGPFTTIMRRAYNDPSHDYTLIIEEINRGNAPAIFGEVFQLLDRKIKTTDDESDDGYPVGTSEYGITHKNMASKIYKDETHKVRIPSNLSIIGTMNTSDQNVFTLDTAFQRRWNMRLISNDFENVRKELAEAPILDTGVSWKKFCTTINKIIIGNKAKMVSAEDKRLGVYFVHESDLTMTSAKAKPSKPDVSLLDEYNALLKEERDKKLDASGVQRLQDIRDGLKEVRIFPEKVIKYLWDDAFKFNPQDLFDTDNMDSLEKVIRTFVFAQGQDRFKIFKSTVQALLNTPEE